MASFILWLSSLIMALLLTFFTIFVLVSFSYFYPFSIIGVIIAILMDVSFIKILIDQK